MSESSVMVGGEGGTYRNTGTYSNPVWDEVVLVRDVTPGGGFDFAEAGSDRQQALKLYAKTQLDKPIQIVMRADITDPEYATWVDAANSRKTALDLLILNKKKEDVGAIGWRGPFLVSLSGEPQPLADGVASTFELRATRDTDGEFVRVAVVESGPALVYTDVGWST